MDEDDRDLHAGLRQFPGFCGGQGSARQPVDIPALVPSGRHSTFRRAITGAPEPLTVGRHGRCDAEAAMTTHRTASGRHTIGAIALVAALSCAAPSPRLAAQAPAPAAENVPSEEQAESFWPHRIDAGDQTILVYQPQVESWIGTQLSARAAVSVESKTSPQPSYGVIWFSARTGVDKTTRLVTLSDVQITKANFPTAADGGAPTLAAVRSHLGEAPHTIGLDRLQANLLVNEAEARTEAAPLKNDPPRIIVSKTPALLVLVDGKPALRSVPKTSLMRIVNTRALMALDPQSGRYYLWLADRWVEAPAIEGPWTTAASPPAALPELKASVAGSREVDLFDDASDDLKTLLAKGELPAIYVSTGPAELLQLQGEPQLAPIDGTGLLQVTNTSSDMLVDPKGSYTYVLISGRWFRARSLDGPWAHVAPDRLPADFAKIPENHPKGRVLTSVAGTPQARQAVIANRIPQTATIGRKDAHFDPTYDGPPRFEPITGTSLAAATNTPSAVIQVGPTSYYGCENGVWFEASAPTGPWAVAATVPEVIYTIPPSSRLYYVTFVRVYDSTPDVVYVGYTSGYYGTYVAPGGVVVYGTGYWYDPWIGNVWIGPPYTYGFGAGFVWGATPGFVLGFTSGLFFDPWWGPWGWGWGWGWRHVDVDVHHHWDYRDHHDFNRGFDAYHHWGAGVVRARPGAVHVGAGEVAHHSGAGLFAGRDGAVYRQGAHGWERNDAGGWKSPGGHDRAATERSLDNNAWARGAGDAARHDFASHDFGRQPFGARTMGGRDFGRGFGGGFHGGGFGGGGFHGGGGGGHR